MDATRACLTLVTRLSMKRDRSAAESNLLAVASSNLAFLRQDKEKSLADVLKRLPLLEGSKETAGSKKKSAASKFQKSKGGQQQSSSGVVLAGATPHQARLALYNRALVQARLGLEDDAAGSIGSLIAALDVKHVDPKRGKGLVAAGTARDGDRAAWLARAEGLRAELEGTAALERAAAGLEECKDDESCGAADYAMAELMLRKAVLDGADDDDGRQKALIDAVGSLPDSIKSRPGAVVTLASLHGLASDEARDLLSGLGDGTAARLALAGCAIDDGRYDEAVESLQAIVDDDEGEEGTETHRTATAMLIRALSYTDPDRAEGYMDLLEEGQPVDDRVGSGDGERLEDMDVPRFSKSGRKSSAVAVASSPPRRGGGTNASAPSSSDGRPGKSREEVLARRARRREAYLARLEGEGRYDPGRTPGPDPERWLPKSQRSTGRGGRRRGGGGRGGNNGKSGAQGGGAGMERDAARLDVAARVQAAREGRSERAGPSTAGMKVSSSGGGRKKGKGRR